MSKSLDTKSMILCMIAIDGDTITGELGGITRLQKLLFLLENELSNGERFEELEFTAYKAGPYSSRIYDELEFLENLGFIDSEIVGETTTEESVEVDALNFEDLMGEESSAKDDVGYADAYVERSFKITKKGMSKVQEILNSGEYTPSLEGIRKIKSKFGKYSLSDLLYYVYTKYPEMTVESEIKDQVLSKRRRA
ncbi:hypothetical protein M902_0726 [Bacteriovorax sp. BAL6_X]|uniref:type II toxin-antitoxin system antitoxin SocA domain-containing protein n=1 Tax=Bacteriovorax sp. BAL6_X TaxID=1201290 RepID=UPI0003856CBE|nr:type II toxin-antitoxin system antitoxin SocA domain-containing protein [Bacteriovorax sp. BAL6_X]EPZ49330.1 hypothetical protein M902_0726 [Bacteriovorax sp. BAL6_X]